MEHIRDAKHLPGFPYCSLVLWCWGSKGGGGWHGAGAGPPGRARQLRSLMPFLSHPCFPCTKPASCVLLLLLAYQPPGAHRHPFWVPL